MTNKTVQAQEQEQKTLQYRVHENFMQKVLTDIQPKLDKLTRNNIPFVFDYIREDTESAWYIVNVSVNIAFKNWAFVASIEHGEHGNIIRNITGRDVPIRYRNTKSTLCEHCNTNRYRKDTYIVYNTDTQEYKQVGKNCLQVYTGINLSNVVCFYDMLTDLENYNNTGSTDITYYEGYSNIHYTCNEYSLNMIIQLAYNTIKKFGYISKVKASESINHENLSTTERTRMFCRCLTGYYSFCRALEKDILKTMRENNISYNENDTTLRDTIVSYLLKLKTSSEFIYNVQTIIKDNVISVKNIGYVVASVGTYIRDMEQIKENKENITSKHVGTVKERITLNIHDLKCVYSYETDFGISYIYSMLDNNNNILTWKTSKRLNENINTITGTVKAHNVYKGINQTEITRCKVQ